ncbi:MAG: RluA family pseudouridine synthase [Clostridia bacterium]|nr:RluA family pseudouridine synthase [Clostridia bacterium]
MAEIIILNVSEEDVGKRLDVFVSERADMTRSAAAKLIEAGRVLVDEKVAPKNLKLSVGSEIEVDIPDPIPMEARPENIPLDIIYEDSDIIVINKPKGMVVHPAAGNYEGTLVSALLYHCKGSLSGIGGVMRPGIVHRIDKDTGGLLVVAKNDAAHLKLSAQLKDHTVSRVYYALVVGNLKEDKGTVDAPIGRNPNDRKKMAVLSPTQGFSRHAVTHYEVLERYRGFCLVRCVLETGRTHQIRVHMAHLGHPLVGDVTYGGGKTAFEQTNKSLICGQCLFAAELSLIHPKTNEKMTFTCELSENMKVLIEKLRKTVG